jgi:acyl carrier protein
MLDGIIECIRECNNLKDIPISENSNLVSHLGLTSYSIIETCCEIEDKFSITIDGSELTKIETVKDIVMYVRSKQLKTPEALGRI